MSGIRRATKLFEGLIFSSVLLLSLNVALALDDDFVADSFLVSANSKAIGVLANEIAEEIGPSFAWGVDLEEKARLALAEYMNLKAGEEYDSIRDFVGYDSYQGDLNFARASVAHTAGL
ncbi:MAG: hypothetical protein KDD53_05425, partial [Bdellovibrionales bacterium]|nr:hypothetical protein [Bdellovibrionales bacterium]